MGEWRRFERAELDTSPPAWINGAKLEFHETVWPSRSGQSVPAGWLRNERLASVKLCHLGELVGHFPAQRGRFDHLNVRSEAAQPPA